MSQAQTGSAEEILADLLVGIDHVGIAVPDLPAAIAHWQRLGFRVDHEESNEEQGVREAMLVASADATCRLQLLAPLRTDSTIATFLDRSGPGIQQLAIRVTDVTAAADRLRAAGLRVLFDAPRRGTANSRINFVHPKDCGGVLLELVEPADAH